MKKTVCVLLSIFLLLSGCVSLPEQEPSVEPAKISAVWIYYSELSMLNEKSKDEKTFNNRIIDMFDRCVELGINTIFLQVRPFSDSFYKSEIFPWSYYLTGKQGNSVEYDPLEICIKLAHERGLALHAWINPFRIAFDDDFLLLSKNHPASDWIKEKSSDVIFVDGGIYYSPASLQAQELVIDGVREIMRNYDVDGIHIDDYFYPSTDKKVDLAYYKEYTDAGGKLNLNEWRLNIVSAFVSQMYTAVKSENSDCIFSISPAGNIQNNYEQQFADVKLWCSKRGYADWIIPQLYYGFEDDKLPFDKALRQWEQLNTIGAVKMIYGIAAYKVNDSNEEWQAGNGIIDKQLALIKDETDSHGVAYFSYSALTDRDKQSEFRNITSIFS